MAAPRVDIASERLALQLSRVDVEANLHSAQLGAQRAMLADQRVAIDLQMEELARLEDTYAGQRMQQSIYTAMLADSRAIAAQRELEQQAINDRTAAARIGHVNPEIPISAHQQLSTGNFDDERLTQLEGAGLDDEERFSDCGLTEVGGTADGDSTPSVTDTDTMIAEDEEEEGEGPQVTLEHYINALHLDETRPLVDCLVCTDAFSPSQTVTLQCGDTWCCGCMSRRYEEAIVNEGVWPVRCCRTEISRESVQNLLPLDLRTRFATKSVEWADNDRTYCHEPSCATYLPHSSITGRHARCSTCRRETCAECKTAYHAQPPCTENTTSDDLLAEAAREHHWPKCPGCNRYVEITTGCNHMT